MFHTIGLDIGISDEREGWHGLNTYHFSKGRSTFPQSNCFNIVYAIR